MLSAERFEPADFDTLAGWRDDTLLDAFAAFRRSAFHTLSKPYRTGSLGVAADAFGEAYAAARREEAKTEAEARAFFERFFRPARVRPDNGRAQGLVTGFYEPSAEGSLERTQRFTVPLLRRPGDLVAVDDSNRPPSLDPSFAWAHATPAGLVPFHDRAAIETGALAGQGLEIVWLADPVDAFFIHVQGAARIHLPDGKTIRLTYAAKSGHPFTGIGRVLLDQGELPQGGVTMQSIRRWLKVHPDRVAEILRKNRSFIFFREADVDDAALGPVAAAKVPLAAGRSVAVDRLLHTFGTPFFISAPTLHAFGDKPFARLMIAQDTGSAILGAARGDLFAGSGDAAGEIAGVVNHPADFTALLPLPLFERPGR